MKLTEKQRAFCDYYIESLNATESYKKAYPNVTKQRTAESAGNRLLSNVEVRKYIDEQLQKMQSNRIADATEVLEYLTKGMRQELEEEVVVTVNKGEFTSEPQIIKKKISIKDSNKCAELLGKRYSLYTEKLEVNGDMGVKIVDDIPDEE
ncbi:terminase small subunit [Intestinibacter sp.]|uniref:terminase small subunit n=1 Tax=Intestinibacter sp. TaxID=1965304 RepID=UPI00307D0657